MRVFDYCVAEDRKVIAKFPFKLEEFGWNDTDQCGGLLKIPFKPKDIHKVARLFGDFVFSENHKFTVPNTYDKIRVCLLVSNDTNPLESLRDVKIEVEWFPLVPEGADLEQELSGYDNKDIFKDGKTEFQYMKDTYVEESKYLEEHWDEKNWKTKGGEWTWLAVKMTNGELGDLYFKVKDYMKAA